MDFPIIKSEKFTLRPYKSSDLDDLVLAINNEKIAKFTLHIPSPYTENDGIAFLNEDLDRQKTERPNCVDLAIEMAGHASGAVGLTIDWSNYKAEIGYWLAEKYWGAGIMSAAVSKILTFGFDTLKLVRIYAHVHPDNVGSQKVLKNNGFVYEGTLRKDAYKNGQFRDHHLYALVR